jgi:energy-coupling factor transporter ATP-binding protein EcfA2
MDTSAEGRNDKASTTLLPTVNWLESDLLAYLADAWGQADYKHITVIGRLRAVEGTGYAFLEDLHNAMTGAKLATLSKISRVHLGVFVPPRELQLFQERSGQASYALAELDLASLERRTERNDPLACAVRPNSLVALSQVPESWGVKTIEPDEAPLLMDFARLAIDERLEQETSAATLRLQTVQQQYTITLAQNQQAEKEAAARQDALRAETNRVTREIAAGQQKIVALDAEFTERRNTLETKLRDLQALLRQRGQRLVALDLVDSKDLDALVPPPEVVDAREGHDFQEVLGGDFARLAPYIQASLWKKNILFSQSQLRNFLALIRTHDLVILAGDSGSGKTSLVRELANCLGGRCTVIPVKPNWTGPEDLLGYYNPIERRYHSTPFLQALQAAKSEPDVPHFICLDEMNMARVEYYFADFLSLLEARDISPTIPLYTSDEEHHVVVENSLFLALEAEARQRAGMPDTATLEEILKNEQANALLRQLGGFQDTESVLLHHARLRRALGTLLRTPTTMCFPDNVRIVGAINIDETTHYLSPKVLDRAHVLRFCNPVLTDWDAIETELVSFDVDVDAPIRLSSSDLGLRRPYPPYDRTDSRAAILASLARQYLDPIGVEFGLRAIRQSLGYLQAASVAGISDQIGLDNVVLQKIMPKLMLDTGRSAVDGRSRFDILTAMRDELGSILEGLQPEAGRETSVVALNRLITSIQGNSGIANYWLR